MGTRVISFGQIPIAPPATGIPTFLPPPGVAPAPAVVPPFVIPPRIPGIPGPELPPRALPVDISLVELLALRPEPATCDLSRLPDVCGDSRIRFADRVVLPPTDIPPGSTIVFGGLGTAGLEMTTLNTEILRLIERSTTLDVRRVGLKPFPSAIPGTLIWVAATTGDEFTRASELRSVLNSLIGTAIQNVTGRRIAILGTLGLARRLPPGPATAATRAEIDGVGELLARATTEIARAFAVALTVAVSMRDLAGSKIAGAKNRVDALDQATAVLLGFEGIAASAVSTAEGARPLAITDPDSARGAIRSAREILDDAEAAMARGFQMRDRPSAGTVGVGALVCNDLDRSLARFPPTKEANVLIRCGLWKQAIARARAAELVQSQVVELEPAAEAGFDAAVPNREAALAAFAEARLQITNIERSIFEPGVLDFLGRRILGLPVWVWGAGAAGGALFIRRRRRMREGA